MRSVDKTVSDDFRNRNADESFEARDPLTEKERSQGFSDFYYWKIDADIEAMQGQW